MTPERYAEIKQLRFTTGINPAAGVFATDTERELYQLAGRCWNALQDLFADHEQLTEANAQAAEELAQWTGALH
ncbi:hypothetical protein [Streptomyces sp. PR69]|uniref:hypothetical protein n=1 Tax=Streptomyces sp. PR69 TaxID=2984950 RepID=UPI002265395C|nr:hypothetical protein [Streptomyces sp. PR69]